MGKGGANQARNVQKQEYAEKRLKDRILSYIRHEVKNASDVVSPAEVQQHLKVKFDEYARRQDQQLEKQITAIMEQVFADVNATNLRKSFYKKKDLVKDDGDDSCS